MRVPHSWLRDFAPFPGDVDQLTASLDDLGLVVEGVERVGAGLEDVVVARVESVDAIEGADRIRRVVVDAGGDPVEVVCGAGNFSVGDLVPLAPVGATLPDGTTIARRKMKGVVSNGMLCSGRELELGEDHSGLLVLGDGNATAPAVGQPLLDALSIEPDVVFDVSVEANRPDAWCIAGIARDLAARLGLPFAIPDRPGPPGADAGAGWPTPAIGPPVATLAVLTDDDPELCPRITARVVTGVRVAPSPPWIARRLTLAGMRPLNNVVDASNYVMLELGQPTHPYDLDRLPGRGLSVRRARPGERLTTLDGVERELGRPGPGLGDTGEDCLICDAEGTPVGIGGIMGGASSEISVTTSTVLLEAAYFAPMGIARTSKRLGLRTEASARFERGTDPAGIDRAAARFVQLLALSAGDDLTVAEGTLDVAGPDVPGPTTLRVRPARVNALLGTDLSPEEVASLLAPIGFEVRLPEAVGGASDAEGPGVEVVVPTFRPDIRPAPMGEADVTEEVARIHGYARLPRRSPSWPQPGGLTGHQRGRRRVKDVLVGLSASEAWTSTFVAEGDLVAAGDVPPFIEVTNPLVEGERWLRTTMAPGLVRALAYNAERRQGSLRLFEVGSVFTRDDGVAGGHRSSERLSAVFGAQGDEAWAAVAAWRTLAAALRLDGAALDQGAPSPGALHPTRSATLLVGDAAGDASRAVGTVGELDPSFVEAMGLLAGDGRPPRVGWLDLDLEVVLDPGRSARRSADARAVSRYPSSDVDLAFAVTEGIPAAAVADTVRAAGGALLESVDLFDVYRGPGLPGGSRSLAFRLRFCADDRTLTDREVGDLRQACIDAVVGAHGATLR